MSCVPEFDMIIKNGIVVTAYEILPVGLQIGVKDGKIASIATSLPHLPGTKIIDAQGGYITPGGVDSHVHLAQDNSPTGDNWESGSRSAIAGGNTTVLAFASQKRTDESLFTVLEEYHRRSRGQSHCDYGFHFILTNPSPQILTTELRVMVEKEGITSVKLYMTYESMKLSDRQLLEIMMTAREIGMTTMIHAENSDMIALITERLEQRNLTLPFYHAIARPQISEDEASYRAIALAELAGAPILLVHQSSRIAMKHTRKAQTRLLPIHAETCPQYLFLLSEKIKADDFEGAKHVCSPPLRHDPSDLEALWEGIANGTFTTFSSDHAPSTFDHPHGKKLGIVDGIPRFSKIPNGLPGIETRLPLLFDQACGDSPRLSLPRFVQLTSTNPAKLYGLDGVKGSIAPGYDADLVIWYPEGKLESGVQISQSMLHHGVDYTPYEGMSVRNWPRYTLLRGKVVWDRDNGGVTGKKGDGGFLMRKKGQVIVGRVGGQVRGMLPGEREMWT